MYIYYLQLNLNKFKILSLLHFGNLRIYLFIGNTYACCPAKVVRNYATYLEKCRKKYHYKLKYSSLIDSNTFVQNLI